MIKNKTSNGMEYYMTAISDKLISTVPNIAKDTQYWVFEGKSLRCKAYPEKTLDLVGVGDLNLNNFEKHRQRQQFRKVGASENEIACNGDLGIMIDDAGMVKCKPRNQAHPQTWIFTKGM